MQDTELRQLLGTDRIDELIMLYFSSLDTFE